MIVSSWGRSLGTRPVEVMDASVCVGVVEGVERFGAIDLELDGVVRSRVSVRDRTAGRVAPPERVLSVS